MKMTRSQLIYETASDPVLSARIAVAKLLCGNPIGSKIDVILAQAQHKAGQAAALAARAPLKGASARHIASLV